MPLPLQNVNANARMRPSSKGDGEKNLWSSLLNSVSTGKKLPEKSLLVLGGDAELQNEFLDTLESDAPKRPRDRHRRKPPVANKYALGYTYQDVFDADHEDLLARLSIHLLSESSPKFTPLLGQVLNAESIPSTLVVLLLDWSEPWHWIRQMRDRIHMLKTVIADFDQESQNAMEETMRYWQQRRRGGANLDSNGTATTEPVVNLPLSPGEWDEPLGLPVCVVCHRTDEIIRLETQYNWREEDFDYILQFLRTILMKHGASLVYTSNSVPNNLPLLIQSSLEIHSLLKKQTLKHNVMDRDKILIPPNWDSWGKIRVIREGFDVEGTSAGWSIDIESSPAPQNPTATASEGLGPSTSTDPGEEDILLPLPEGSVIPPYESTVQNPHPPSPPTRPMIDTEVTPNQIFLAEQQEAMNKLKAKEEAEAAAEAAKAEEQEREQASLSGDGTSDVGRKPRSDFERLSTRLSQNADARRLQEQIGPVQTNVGGIEVDAEDMVAKMKRRNARSDDLESETSTPVKKGGASGKEVETPDSKSNEALSNFFSDLLKRGGTGSPRTPASGRKKAREGSNMRDVSSAGSEK